MRLITCLGIHPSHHLLCLEPALKAAPCALDLCSVLSHVWVASLFSAQQGLWVAATLLSETVSLLCSLNPQGASALGLGPCGFAYTLLGLEGQGEDWGPCPGQSHRGGWPMSFGVVWLLVTSLMTAGPGEPRWAVPDTRFWRDMGAGGPCREGDIAPGPPVLRGVHMKGPLC